ncbi:hydrogenase nickel incorporation protein HypA/HybF [Paucidesulfovibrio gracilis DSM 16080]|uniref:Hydrogenase maturation factor HypA n=2 Tax=Paucidesulfovibrio TaxID=2910985 RepID=A0A1T4X1T0_9BACT|nr:hydrogenase nickel incorporation protein HypA/HybF [Paucidesulfovibrio gracilis DSM 16080]
MHEMSLIDSILNILADERSKQNLGKITKVTLQNGKLAGVVTEALLFAWEALTPGTQFEGCEIEVRETPLILRCFSCKKEFEAESAMLAECPECGQEIGHEVVSGREFLIENVEVEDSEGEAGGDTAPTS